MHDGVKSVERFVHVTPIWKPQLEVEEVWNVERSLNIAGRANVEFVAPTGLNVDYYRAKFPGVSIRRVDAHYLQSVGSYNELMLSPDFYQCYDQYEFVLVVQTDAVLLRDVGTLELTGVDYVGAPWTAGLKYRKIASRLSVWMPQSGHRAASPLHIVARYGGRTAFVGNGGLSIRRVVAFINMCQEFRDLVPHYLKSNLNEDVVFSTVGRDRGLRVGSVDFAGQVFREHLSVQQATLMDLYGVHAPARITGSAGTLC